MRHLGLPIALTLTLILIAGAACATEEAEPPVASSAEPRTGEITAHDVNVRAGAHPNYEVLTQLDKGDLVLVTGTRGDWKRIAMPPGVLVWTSTSYVADDGLVEGQNVNVRSGPALKYNVLCQLKRDDQVVIKKTSKDGDWYGIVPPKAAGAFVYAKYVADKGPPELYAKWAPRKAQCTALLASANNFRQYELKRPDAEVRFDAIIANYRRIETDYPDLPEARIAQRRIREIERIKTATIERLAAAGGATGASGDKPPAGSDEEQTTPEPKVLTAKGVLREISRASTSKGLYRITKEDRWVCIVKSATIELGPYAGKAVQVWGPEAPSEGWSLRTISVSRIKLLE
jgi:SH3-like domain-containing protein